MTDNAGISEELRSLLMLPGNPSLPTVEVLARAALRALGGLSAIVDEEDRTDGDGWPSRKADIAILLVLRCHISIAAAIWHQDERIIRLLRRPEPKIDATWQPVAQSQAAALDASQLTKELVATFFSGERVNSRTFWKKYSRALELCRVAYLNANTEYMLETDDHSASVGPNSYLLEQPLYSAWVDRENVESKDAIEARINAWEGHDVLNGLHKRGAHFGFWTNWFEGFLFGRPIDWQLQLEVAMIPNEVWFEGPQAIAQKIVQIEARLDVSKALDEFPRKNELVASDRHGIGGNAPPEQLEEIDQVLQHTVFVWEGVETLRQEISSAMPDKTRIEKALTLLSSGLTASLRWSGQKADLAVDTLIKWGVPTGCAYVLTNPEAVQALIKSVKKWLSLL